MEIKFKNKPHEKFYSEMQEKVQEVGGSWDMYTMPLFYILGISEECRRNISDLVEIDGYGVRIKLEALEEAWQTSGSIRCTRLGFNLFNGYDDGEVTPYKLFHDLEYFPYFVQGCELAIG